MTPSLTPIQDCSRSNTKLVASTPIASAIAFPTSLTAAKIALTGARTSLNAAPKASTVTAAIYCI